MCFKLLLFKVKTTAQIREHQIIFGHEVTSQNFREQCRRRIIIIVGSDCQSTRPVQQNHNKSDNMSRFNVNTIHQAKVVKSSNAY